MKRLYIAVALLLAASALCAYEMISVKNTTSEYSDILDKIAETAETGDKTEAEILSEIMIKNWDKESKKLDKFVYHDYVDNITVSLSEVPLYVKSASIDETRSHIKGIKIQLASLNESELPYIHNIF